MSDLNNAEVLTNVTIENVQHSLRKVLNDDTLEVTSLESVPLVKKGENYMSIILSADAETKSEKHGAKTYNLVAKLAPADPGRRKFLEMLDMFPKENFIYNTFYPELVRLQTRRNVAHPILPAVPKIYVPEDEKEMILLFENLKTSGYRLADKLFGLDYNHCKLVIKELAHIHALSYAFIQDIEPQVLDEKYPLLIDKFQSPEFEAQGKQFTESNFKTAFIALDALGPECAELKRRLSEFQDGSFERTNELFKARDGIVVVNHGDCWINNMMFRYDEDNAPVELKFVDLQMPRHADCCIDLSYMFYTSTTRELRDKHMYELLEMYFSIFKETLKLVDATEPENFTFESLKQQFNKFKEIGLGMAIALLPLMLARPDETVDMENMPTDNDADMFAGLQNKMEEAMKKMVKTNKDFCNRLTGVLQEMADDNVI